MKNIGFIGLGIMGESMCENIVKKHDGKVYCFDLNAAQVKKLESVGAIPASNNVEVAKASDVIISMLPRSEHVRSVYEEIMPYLAGKLCIDMSTIDPDVSVEIASRVKEEGGRFLDAPVVKSKPAAISGTLGIYVGCDEELFDEVLPILKYMGSNVIRMGGNGQGLVMKICHNSLVAEIQNGVNELIVLAKKYGISIEDFAKAISYGGGQNFYLDGQWKNLENENYATAFSFENMHKDLTIAARMLELSGVKAPGLENAKRVYDRGMKQGYAKEDFRATFKVVRGDKDE